MNLILDNQRVTYKKVGVDYEPKNKDKRFSNIFYVNRTSDLNIIICNHFIKYDRVVLFYFIRKNHEYKNMYFLSHFYKWYHENKMKNMHVSSYMIIILVVNVDNICIPRKTIQKVLGGKCQKVKLWYIYDW